MALLWRIQDRSTFGELRRCGRHVRRGPLTVTWLPGDEGDPPRVAFAIGRGVGGAVTRNSVRRRLRAVMRELASDVPPGAYLLGASPAAATQTFDEMRETVSTAIAALAPQSEPGASRRSGR